MINMELKGNHFDHPLGMYRVKRNYKIQYRGTRVVYRREVHNEVMSRRS